MATSCLTDGKIMCSTFIPQGHDANQIRLQCILKKTCGYHGNVLSEEKNNILYITQIASNTQNLTFMDQAVHSDTKMCGYHGNTFFLY